MNNFKTNIKFHNELRACANATYKKRGYTIPSEYKIEKDVQNSYTGFTALVLKKGNSIIIAYGGTHDIKDLNADFQMTKKIVPLTRTRWKNRKKLSLSFVRVIIIVGLLRVKRILF